MLDELKLSDRKGFPESYDRAAFLTFLADIKSGKPKVGVPVYSHLSTTSSPASRSPSTARTS